MIMISRMIQRNSGSGAFKEQSNVAIKHKGMKDGFTLHMGRDTARWQPSLFLYYILGEF